MKNEERINKKINSKKDVTLSSRKSTILRDCRDTFSQRLDNVADSANHSDEHDQWRGQLCISDSLCTLSVQSQTLAWTCSTVTWLVETLMIFPWSDEVTAQQVLRFDVISFTTSDHVKISVPGKSQSEFTEFLLLILDNQNLSERKLTDTKTKIDIHTNTTKRKSKHTHVHTEKNETHTHAHSEKNKTHTQKNWEHDFLYNYIKKSICLSRLQRYPLEAFFCFLSFMLLFFLKKNFFEGSLICSFYYYFVFVWFLICLIFSIYFFPRFFSIFFF